MASLLPLISEILPMILPASAHVMRADQLRPAAASAADGPVVTRGAIIDKCDKIWTAVLTIRPHSSSQVRHNSEQDAIIYAAAGTGILMIKEGVEADVMRYRLGQGDFAWIPAWTEHQVQNDTNTDVVWIVFQSGPHPVGATLADWGGNELSA